MRRLSFPLCILLTAACARGDVVTLHLDAEPPTGPATREWTVSARPAGDHAVTVREVIRVPDPCHALDAAVLLKSSHLTLRVTAVPDGGGCAEGEAETMIPYTATLENVPSGLWDLRVVHRVDGGRSRTVLRHPVMVR